MELLHSVFRHLEEKGSLPAKYKTHKLKGNFVNHLECHIQPDWLLIWVYNLEKKEIYMTRTGTHSDLF